MMSHVQDSQSALIYSKRSLQCHSDVHVLSKQDSSSSDDYLPGIRSADSGFRLTGKEVSLWIRLSEKMHLFGEYETGFTVELNPNSIIESTL